MKLKLLLGLLLLLSVQVFSQNKKWSAEVNYPISAGEENTRLDNSNGIIDFGLKHRFTDFGFMKLGAGLNAGLFSDSSNFTYGTADADNVEYASDAKNYLVQPKIFAEFIIPVIKKLKPSVGLGYSVVVSDLFISDDGEMVTDDTFTNGGVNLNLGLSYDITRNIFIQAQFDYINLKVKDDYRVEGQNFTYEDKLNTNLLKFGVGIRF